MKKILVALLVMALVAPAFAVTFTLTPGAAGTGKLTVAYDLGAGEVLRGMALKVKVNSGNAVIDQTTDVVLQPATFNTFIDYAFSNPVGYVVGAGNCLANPAAAGVLDLSTPKNEFVVSLGFLDTAGGQAGLTADSFFDIFFTLSTNSVVEVSLDTLRGGIVGDALVASNLPLTATVIGAPAEAITQPTVAKTTAAPAAAARVNSGRVETFLASATSNLGHTLEYAFTWGDGSPVVWGPATQTHTYTYAASTAYNVTVQARCIADPAVVSAASSALALTSEAVKSTATFYATWAAWNRPACWAYNRNCHGDTNSLATGLGVNRQWSNSADLTLLSAGFNKIEAALAAVPNGICADFNRLATGLGVNRQWVNSADLTVLSTYFNKIEAVNTICVQTNYWYWTSNTILY